MCYPVAGYALGVKASWEPVQEGSGTPSPENIRPIKGRDSVTVERCGANLLDIEQCRPASLAAAYGLTVTVDDTGLIRVFGIPNVDKDIPKGIFRILFTDQAILTKEYKAKWFVVKGAVKEATIIQNDKSILLQSPLSPNTPVDIQFRLMYYTGTTDPTTYTPYIGQTNTLTLPETVYGGEVDAVSSEGQETWKFVILNGTESWCTWGINAHNPAVTGFYTYDINDYDAINVKAVCSHLSSSEPSVLGGSNAGIGFATVGETRYFMYCLPTSLLPDISAGHEAAALKAYLAAQNAAGTPVQIAYKLADPVPFTATGAQPIPALAGVNTVLTDADSATVTGRADPIKRITDLEDAVASQT